MSVIPKIIHQIWTQGCDKIPEKYKNYTDGWKAKEAEGYQYMCWSDESLIDLIKKYDPSLVEVYTYFELPQQRSDLGRYLLLYIYGGFYIDMDIEAGDKSLDILIDNKFVIASGGFSTFRQSFMGSCPNHNIFKDAITHIIKTYKRKWYEYEYINFLYVERTTGGIISTILNKNKITNEYTIHSIDQKLVFFCENIDDCNIINTNIIAMMHYEKSWNIFLYIRRFIVYYKYMMLFTLLFLVYIISGKCNSTVIGSLCDIRTLIKLVIFTTLLYNALHLLTNSVVCRTGILYFCLLCLSYYSLDKKCDTCHL
jgi:mannosyltransferase OCH1-like enzyme